MDKHPSTENIVEIQRMVSSMVKPHRRKYIITHPNNYEKIKACLEPIEKNPDIHIIKPYVILQDKLVPETEQKPTGKLLWYHWAYAVLCLGSKRIGSLFGMTYPELEEYMVFWELSETPSLANLIDNKF